MAQAEPLPAPAGLRFGTVLWSLGFGWLLTAIVLVVPLDVIERLIYVEAAPTPRGSPFVLFTPHDLGSLLAAAALPLACVGVFTVIVRAVLARAPDGVDVAPAPLAAILAVTSAFALLPHTSVDDGLAWRVLMAWVAAAYLISRLPPRSRPRRSRWQAVLAGVVAGIGLLALPVSYGRQHPVQVTTGMGSDPFPVACVAFDRCAVSEGGVHRALVAIDNVGRRPVTVLALDIEGIPSALRLERIRQYKDYVDGVDPPLTLPQTIEPGNSLLLVATMRLSPSGCEALPEAGNPASIGGVRLRYRVRGRTTTDAVPIRPAPRILRCTGRRVRWGSDSPPAA